MDKTCYQHGSFKTKDTKMTFIFSSRKNEICRTYSEERRFGEFETYMKATG